MVGELSAHAGGYYMPIHSRVKGDSALIPPIPNHSHAISETEPLISWGVEGVLAHAFNTLH